MARKTIITKVRFYKPDGKMLEFQLGANIMDCGIVSEINCMKDESTIFYSNGNFTKFYGLPTVFLTEPTR